MKQRSYSMQKINYSQKSVPKRIEAPRPRLNFPLPGDSNLYAGSCGRKHYHEQFKDAPSILLRRNQSQNNIFIRNTLNVRDIQGAYPSIKPQTERNKLKNLQFLSLAPMNKQPRKKIQVDSLQKLSEQFDLRSSHNPQINKYNKRKDNQNQDYPYSYKKPDIIKPIEFGINQNFFEKLATSNNNVKNTPRAFNPTYLSNFQMY